MIPQPENPQAWEWLTQLFKSRNAGGWLEKNWPRNGRDKKKVPKPRGTTTLLYDFIFGIPGPRRGIDAGRRFHRWCLTRNAKNSVLCSLSNRPQSLDVGGGGGASRRFRSLPEWGKPWARGEEEGGLLGGLGGVKARSTGQLLEDVDVGHGGPLGGG